jgi:hypothetical protein
MDKQKFGGYVWGFEQGCCTPENPCYDDTSSNVCKECQQGTCMMDTRDSLEGDPICKTCGEEMEMSEVHEGYVCLNDHDEIRLQRGS